MVQETRGPDRRAEFSIECPGALDGQMQTSLQAKQLPCPCCFGDRLPVPTCITDAQEGTVGQGTTHSPVRFRTH